MTHRFFSLDRIGQDLPVAEARQRLAAAANSGAFVVTAPPGTGKTTFVPPLVANELAARGDAATGRVILTQPRRVAARAVANRLAELSGSPLGDLVGLTIRGERAVSNGTAIEIVTPGVLLRRLIADPELPGVGAVVLDEVHERSVEGDLLLGMLAEARALRADLVLCAMSATLESAAMAELIGDGSPAPVVEIPGVLHELAIDHAPFGAQRIDERGVSRDYLAHVARVTLDAQAKADCDALVFVPGAREVDELVARLTEAATGLEILPLHGQVSPKDQDRAVRGGGADGPGRIIVSTAIAESSLTVPGVNLVIDAGLAREIRRDQGRDMTGLTTVSASRASAVQRAGRAARTGPGRAVRAYSESEYAHMRPASMPEIAAADLTEAALLLAAWGTPRGDGLALLTPPPTAAMTSAVDTLATLGLVDAGGAITAAGRRVALLPVGARAARALTEGAAQLGSAEAAAEIVAAFSDDFRDQGADLTRLLRELRTGRHPGAGKWKRETVRLARIARDAAGTDLGGTAAQFDVHTAAGTVVALARPERIARRTGANSRSYLLASGTRAGLPEGSDLLASEWLAVHEVQRAEGRQADGTGAVIRLAAPLDERTALELGGPLVVAARQAEIVAGKLRVREEKRLGAIVLASTPATAGPGDTGRAFAAHIREAGIGALEWSDNGAALRARLGMLHRELGAPWPDVSDEALLATLDDWLGQDLAALSPTARLGSLDLASALRRLLPWPEAAKLDELAPEALAVPSGSKIRIAYPEAGDDDRRPVVAVKLQELFGLAATPRLVLGRVPVLFHMLSPARKPLAITDDLESFWNGPYQDVRKEMRGRYPKHPWPEDPWTAPATARTKRAAGIK